MWVSLEEDKSQDEGPVDYGAKHEQLKRHLLDLEKGGVIAYSHTNLDDVSAKSEPAKVDIGFPDKVKGFSLILVELQANYRLVLKEVSRPATDSDLKELKRTEEQFSKIVDESF